MKITLKDFGPISHFEFDLEKDLHVIFGKNNIGKSYAITAVYLILKNWAEDTNQLYIKSEIIKYNAGDISKNIIENDKKTGQFEFLDITKKIEDTFRSIIEGVFAQKLTLSLNNSFPAVNRLNNQRTKKNFKIDLKQKHFTITFSPNEQLNLLYASSIKINLPILLKRSESSDKAYILNYDNGENHFDGAIEAIKYLYDIFIEKELSSINGIYFLPASRSGLYQGLSSFSSIIAELSKSRNLLTQKIELPNISEPVADYFLNLSNISNKAKNDFDEIIETIEKDILKGTVSFNNETKKLVFKENGIDEELDLSHTSSMVSEIAPIVAYLKYIINDKNNQPNNKYGLLFIEEPEAHLHPEVQVKLMEMFALLAGKNVKIVMTSHSNYMFNKLSNLLLEGKIDHNKVGSYLTRATDAGSITDTLSMKAEADGMNDENFADVAEMLYEERIKIYDKLNKEAKDAD